MANEQKIIDKIIDDANVRANEIIEIANKEAENVLAKKHEELKKEEREEERKVLRYISGIIRSEEPALRAAYNFLVELDILLAKIALAGKYDGRMLSFIEDGEVHLRDLEVKNDQL